MTTYTLPPLPEPKPFKEWTGAYDNADMKAYGQQCREAALEEAAEPLDDIADLATLAMSKAWSLGQKYWQQADSESFSQHKKADETKAKYQLLVDETHAAILAKRKP